MPFAQAAMGVAQFGLDLYSSINANKMAKKQLQLQRDQFDFMKQQTAGNNAMADELLGMARTGLDNTYGLQDYFQNINRSREANALELQDYLRGWTNLNYGNLGQERDYTIQRQQTQDQAEALRRQYDLQRIANNERLSQQERAFAIQQLERERQIASSERQEEQGKIADFEAGKRSEYQERYGRLLADRQMRAQEAAFERAKQDRVLTQTSAMRDGIARVLSEQGRLTAPELLGPEAIDAETAKRAQVYTGALDRLSEKVLSQNEASLIRRGMDTGGDSGQRRAEMIAQLEPEYQKAYLQASNEAGQFVEGKNKTLTDRFAILKAARDQALNETQAQYGAGLDLETRLNQVGSGVLDRDIGTGTEYLSPRTSQLGVQSPVQIGSGVYDRLSPTSTGYSDYLAPNSRVLSPTTQSASYDVMNVPQIDFASMIGNASGLRGGAMQGAGYMLDSATKSAQAAGSAAGLANSKLFGGLKNLAGIVGGYGDADNPLGGFMRGLSYRNASPFGEVTQNNFPTATPSTFAANVPGLSVFRGMS